MSRFTLPTFNITVNIWRNTAGVPPVGAPALSPRANLAWGRRVNVASTGGTFTVGVPLLTMYLLLPPLTDVRGQGTGGPDIVEAPAGSGRLYTATFVDDVGKGFLNEHRCVVMQQTGAGLWPAPIP